MNVLERLSAFNVDRADMPDMVELLAQAEPVRSKYEALNLPVPEALTEGIRTLNREVQRRAFDEINRRLRELASQDAADRTASERRADRARERSSLEAQLKSAETPQLA